MAAMTQERTADLEASDHADRHRSRRPDAPPARRLDGPGRAAHAGAADERPRAARGAVPLRRRAPGVRDARRRHPPPARAARRRRRSPGHARRAANITGRKLATRPVAAIAATGVKQMAQRFIVGADAKDSLPTITGAVEERRRRDRRPARRGHRLRGRGRPLHAALRGRPCARSPAAASQVPAATSTSPSRSPRSRRCCAPRRPSAGSRARDRACATCCASPATSAPTCTSTWSPSTRARRSPALTLDLLVRARVRRRPVRRHRPAGLPRRLARVPRRAARLGARARRARTRSRSAWSRAPTGTTRSSRPPSTAGRRRSSPTAASATATSSCSPSA